MRNLEDDLCRNPEAVGRNLWFYPVEEIGEYAFSRRPAAARIACVAELFRREFLHRGAAQKEIDRVLPNGELRDFRRRFDDDFLDARNKRELLNEAPLWSGESEFSRRCAVAVCANLLALCEETDGFIPVYVTGKAFFIPFHFVDGPGTISDAAGVPIENWQPAYRRVFDAAVPPYSCVVDCDQSELPPLTGTSFMLPLHLAYLRKCGELDYNPLRLLATGAIVDGQLQPVETVEKATMLSQNFLDGFLFFPESAKYCPERSSEVPIPRWTLAELRQEMPALVEAKGLVVPSFPDALRRLEVIAEDRESNYRHWELMLDRLNTNMDAIPDYRAPAPYLKCLMLKSSILCHMGRTADALALNEGARDFAAKNGFELELRRLEVEELVDLQDCECFDHILALAEDLHRGIEALDDDDLRMRYYGTMGQAYCCGALAGHPGFDREQARAFFDLALKYATALRDRGGMGSEGDIAQDLNYRFMWYALFSPETPEAEKRYREAKRHIYNNLEGKVREKNRRFLHRLKTFSLYRHLLGGGSEPETLPETLRAEYPHDWLAALTGKYVGALTAAAGQTTEAAEIFREYAGILRDASEPILRFIQMTILAEAYRSTGETAYREEAVALLALLKEPYPGSVGQWEEFLRGKNSFPGLNYWY